MIRRIITSLGDMGRVIRAAGYSITGLRTALREEAAFRQEFALFVIFSPLAVWLGENGIERALLLGSLFLVLIAELLNSAIEAAVDRVSRRPHKLSGRAKDMGSAAVFLSLILVVVTWSLVLLDRW